MRALTVIAIGSLGLVGCGPTENPGQYYDDPLPDAAAQETPDEPSLPDTPPPVYADVTGRVWAPGQAPGMVLAGHEIPISNALVMIGQNRPAPIPQHAYCEECVPPTGSHTFTDALGNFTVRDVREGEHWVIIQKGQFRLELPIVVQGSAPVALAAEQTTLPSHHDPDNGRWIPRIALAAGTYDHMQDILGKMGMGAIDGSGRFVPESGTEIFDMYHNDWNPTSGAVGDLTALVSDLDRMLQYHIIFIPCSGTSHTAALLEQNNLRNIRDYVAAGGKLYVTDWSGEWADNVFPAQITLGGGEDTPAGAYNPETDTWNTAMFGPADGSFYDSNNAEIAE
ncbi:MAG: hypothetical protein AAGC55_20465, partial [Myxococcota bacterium]